MDWISHYQVVLFDFDGLLVDTEPLHYAAYMRMCKEQGIFLNWDFAKFCQEAHSRENGFFYALQQEYPTVFDRMSQSDLYAEKKRLYGEMLETFPLFLMDGVESVLLALQQKKVKRAVVTNSPRVQVELIKSKLPLLKTIPVWLTREDYSRAKPSPEGYLKAISLLKGEKEKAIGFEDALRGVHSLLAAGADAVLVSPRHLGPMQECRQLGVRHIEKLSLTI